MKALFTLKSALNHSSYLGVAALIAIVPLIMPQWAFAAELQTSGQQQALVFQIKDSSSITNSNKNNISLDDIASQDPLVQKVEQYLKDHNSPLYVYSAEIVQQPQWQRALGVSFVESNFGQFCYDNNCSGIGVKPGHPAWRKYPNKLSWFIDLNNLLESPLYKDKYNTFKKMKGVYVNPGSEAWVYGAQKTYNELMALTQEAEADRTQNAQQTAHNLASLPTFPELALLTK